MEAPESKDHTEAFGAPWEAQIFVLWKLLIPDSLSLMPYSHPTGFIGWSSPEYKSLESKRLCRQIHLDYTAYHTCLF